MALIVAYTQFHLPLPGFDEPVATEAFFTVPAAGLWQVIHCPVTRD